MGDKTKIAEISVQEVEMTTGKLTQYASTTETSLSLQSCSFFFQDFYAKSVATDVNATVSVQRTRHRTHVYAHFSRPHLARDDCMCSSKLKVWRVLKDQSISDHVLLGCPISSVPSDFLFTNLFSDATFRIIYTIGWNQKKPLCHSVVEWNVWPSGQSVSHIQNVRPFQSGGKWWTKKFFKARLWAAFGMKQLVRKKVGTFRLQKGVGQIIVGSCGQGKAKWN